MERESAAPAETHPIPGPELAAIAACCCAGDEGLPPAEPALVSLPERPDRPLDVAVLPATVSDPATALSASRRCGPGDQTPARPAGRDLLSLHQTFLI